MNQFEQLAADMNTLAKSQGAVGDQAAEGAAAATDAAAAAAAATAAAAAGEGGDAGAGAGAGAAGEGGGGGEGGETDELLGKSQTATIDGQDVQVIDATEMLKSLHAQVGALTKANDDDKEHLGKALTVMADLLKSQAQSIATLTAQVQAQGSQGRGRKAILTVGEGAGAAGGSAGAMTDLAKAGVEGADIIVNGRHHPGGVDPDTFMAKALEAQVAGRILGRDVAIAESHLNRGIPVDPAVVRKVLQ